jgi:tetratricopeptide (TPR) repeat protein
MRAYLIALLFAQFAFTYAPETGLAQGAQHPSGTTLKGDVADIAEQLVAQAQKWFETFGAEGKVPRVFTGITRDARQLIIELDSLPFDDVKRRDFMIWLSQRYDLIAYAYATQVTKQVPGRADPTEALDIYASSLEKDVFADLSITRQPDGSIRYVRDVYVSEDAKDHRDQIFFGLHRFPRSAVITSSKELEDIWATLESKVYWRGVNKQANEPSGDDAGTLITQALQLYASGNCEAALSLGERATDLLRKQDRVRSRDFATALVAQALCHKRLVHVAEAERLYRQAIEIYEKVAGTNSRDLAIALDNLAALYTEHGRLSEAEQLRLRALQIFKTTLAPDSPHIATALQNLAVLYQYQARVSDAQETFLEALPIAEKASARTTGRSA